MSKFDDGGCISSPVERIKDAEGNDIYLMGERSFTLWDWYAGQAVEGMSANAQVLKSMINGTITDEKTGEVVTDMIEFITSSAEEQADAMIAKKRRREKETTTPGPVFTVTQAAHNAIKEENAGLLEIIVRLQKELK